MIRLEDIKLPLEHDAEALKLAVLRRLKIPPESLLCLRVFRRGHDARNKQHILFTYTLDVEVKDEESALRGLAADNRIRRSPDMAYHFDVKPPAQFKRPLVIGAGPCGLFAALVLAQAGFRPIIVERGKVVRARTRDTWALWRHGVLNPNSNVQFGEGGAGTFSDGKLYSQIKDPRYLGRKVLREFVQAGAPEEILSEAHPHIGTFRLVSMVESLRKEIERLGGEYRFQSQVTELLLGRERKLQGVVLETGEIVACDHVILAIGHSARDSFQMLYDCGVAIEAKPFSLGLRIEHPQGSIDKARFGRSIPLLGAAEYRLVHHARNARNVYSFCMCPGGTVVAATSEEGQVVTNGMSQYSRNARNANAAIVVGITPAIDFPGHPLAGIALQRQWERKAFLAGGGSYAAPVQLVGDFIRAKPSQGLGEVIPSYKPAVTPADLSLCLPDYALQAIREALVAFARQIEGFDRYDAVLTGVETRTSSPVRIPRGNDFQSLNTAGLYPAGEGAGFAGGIFSAAIDGIKVAEAAARSMAAV